MTSESPGVSRLDLHQAVFKDDVKLLASKLKEKDVDVDEKDPHGNTPLMLAVMLNRMECIAILLAHSAQVKVKNAQGWSPLAEAISFGDRQSITNLLRILKQQSRSAMQSQKSRLLSALESLGDFYMELKWDFQSWIPLVSRILPSDVCKVHKKGTKLRLDTTLIDFNEKNWERGDVSFVFDSTAESSKSLVVLDNKARVFQYVRYQDSTTEIQEEVDVLMSHDIVSAQLSTREVTFTRTQTGWIWHHERSEKIGPFNADFFTLENLVVVTLKRREHLSPEDLAKNKRLFKNLQIGDLTDCDSVIHHRKSLPQPNSPLVKWEDYVAAEPGSPPCLAREPVVKRAVRSFKANIAMCTTFPMTIAQLLDILEVIAPFKQFRKLRDFCEVKLPEGFPIKVEIPLLPTITAKITFQEFRFEEGISDDLFSVPGTYREDNTRFSDL